MLIYYILNDKSVAYDRKYHTIHVTEEKSFTVFVFFLFTFIEHKNFWQNAKSNCVFLLFLVSIQYLHRWKRTEDRGVVAYRCLTYSMRAVVYREKRELWINDQLLAMKAEDYCLTEYEAVVCYTVVCWWLLLWEREPWHDVFSTFQNLKQFLLLCLLLPNAEQNEKNLLKKSLYSDWIKWWTQREKWLLLCQSCIFEVSEWGGLAHPMISGAVTWVEKVFM